MPAASVVFFWNGSSAPVVEWLSDLRTKDRHGFANGIARMKLLRDEGYSLDRPACGFLGDDIYELRWKHHSVQYRILYFFHARNTAVLAHAFVKRDSMVPKEEIKRATERKKKFDVNPRAHTLQKEIDDV